MYLIIFFKKLQNFVKKCRIMKTYDIITFDNIKTAYWRFHCLVLRNVKTMLNKVSQTNKTLKTLVNLCCLCSIGDHYPYSVLITEF